MRTGEDVARELGDLVGRLIIVQESADGDAAGVAEGSIAKPLRQDEVLARVKAALPPPASDTADAVPEVLAASKATCSMSAAASAGTSSAAKCR